MVFHSELGQLAVVALAALLCGLVFVRFKQPAIVGYILAGVILGPSALGLVENREWVAMLAELGVLLLLFVIAMKLSLRAFRTIWKLFWKLRMSVQGRNSTAAFLPSRSSDCRKERHWKFALQTCESPWHNEGIAGDVGVSCELRTT